MKKSIYYLMIMFILSACDSSNEEIKMKFNEVECQKNWAMCLVFPDKEYTINRLDKPKKVAILDSGINDKHPALRGQIVAKYNVINKSKYTKDKYGHGTSIAGIIAAKQNDETVQGINPLIEIYDVKVIDDQGGGEVSHVIEGIKWSMDKKVDLINISFGFKQDVPELRKVVDEAIERGIIIIASAGNNYGLNLDFPARYENVISVGSINKKLESSSFNSIGEIDIFAPGEGILVFQNDNKAVLEDGSSLATAYVTGVLSLNSILKHNKQIKKENRINVITYYR
ncbi:S8 family serine peptidase [Peribacillus sp. NPDC101480]|uniref:S8 family serine peptidase n=1 Tax=Peribacillus sp. NPDC101480 TaxID=3390620 RepID=UPI003D0546DB